MSPRGSPDYTDRVHQEHNRYDNVYYMDVWGAVPTLPDWKVIVDIAPIGGVARPGMFGYLWGYCTNPFMYARVTLDGTVIYFLNLWNLRVLGLWGYENCWRKMNITRWDDINERYAFVYDEEWAMVFNESLRVELAHDFGNVGNAGVNVWYKLLHP